MGCHGNHAFSHSTNKCFRANVSQIGGWGSNEQYGTHEKIVLRGAWWIKLDPGVIVTSIYLYFH